MGDDIDVVMGNREILRKTLNLPAKPVWLNQCHGNQVYIADADYEGLCPQADAIITHQANTVCVVLTADCLPILITNTKGTVVSAIHAGWRGLAKGIIQQVITHLQENSNDLLVWLGPAIGPEVFEVSEEMRTIFFELNEANEAAFTPMGNKKWLANLYQLAKIQLQNSGIKSIYGGEHCTYNNPEFFYSYRRDQGITGRIATLIWFSSQAGDL